MEIFLIGLLTALGFIIIILKIGVHHFTRFDWQVDLLISGAIVLIFSGTFIGLASGIVAGIIISLFLTTARKLNL